MVWWWSEFCVHIDVGFYFPPKKLLWESWDFTELRGSVQLCGPYSAPIGIWCKFRVCWVCSLSKGVCTSMVGIASQGLLSHVPGCVTPAWLQDCLQSLIVQFSGQGSPGSVPHNCRWTPSRVWGSRMFWGDRVFWNGQPLNKWKAYEPSRLFVLVPLGRMIKDSCVHINMETVF